MTRQTIGIVGNGGRELAIACTFEVEDCTVLMLTPDQALSTWADLFVIGPEQPLVEGLADKLRAVGKSVFGPSAAHARLEGSKIFMKTCLTAAGIRTAPWNAFLPGQEENFIQYLRDTEWAGWKGWVVKTDYLQGGKGVFVTDDVEEALQDGLSKLKEGAIVVERKLVGREVSFFAIVSSDRSFCFLPSARDYKPAYDGDQGPNTGGMGSYSPVEDGISLQERTTIVEKLLSVPEMKGYTGVLFGGMMITDDGAYVLEFNIRFGDPETQSIMPRLDVNLSEVLMSAASGGQLPQGELPASGACVTVVLASEGYPAKPITGRVIYGLDDSDNSDFHVLVHRAGVKLDEQLRPVTGGGRVINVTARADTIQEAREAAYRVAGKIDFEGKQLRSDIAAE